MLLLCIAPRENPAPGTLMDPEATKSVPEELLPTSTLCVGRTFKQAMIITDITARKVQGHLEMYRKCLGETLKAGW